MVLDDISICKRVNNTKRNFLILNKAQCKHYPISPTKALNMFSELGKMVYFRNKRQRVLIIGFAETATALAQYIAILNNYDYIQTTREDLNGDYLIFDESHSHAVEQKLFDIGFESYDYILFVDDEITTGNTVCHLMEQIQGVVSKPKKFGMASLLSSMSEEREAELVEQGIDVFYLGHLDKSGFEDKVSSYEDNLNIHDYYMAKSVDFKIVNSGVVLRDFRYGCMHTDYKQYKNDLYTAAYNLMNYCNEGDKVLILGTEEFMYPAIRIGAWFENKGFDVKCHSTTRSPIMTCDAKEYPLKFADKLPSVYDISRKTYIYNLDKYDRVFIVTETDVPAIDFLIKVLADRGNESIYVAKIGVRLH